MLYTDSTHLKANANKNKFDVARVEVKPQEYLAQLEAAIDEDRSAHGKRELKTKTAAPETKEIKVSRTDEDSGYMVRDGKPKGFFYLDHRTVDGRHAIITDTHVTPANVHDSVPYLRRLDRQRERFGFEVHAVGLDAGYCDSGDCKRAGRARHLWRDRLSHAQPRGRFVPQTQFRYDEENDFYVCPNGQLLVYRTTNREGYRQYHSDAKQCRDCPLRAQCTPQPQLHQGRHPACLAGSKNKSMHTGWNRGASASINEEKRRSNAASPTPSSCTATATPVCAG